MIIKTFESTSPLGTVIVTAYIIDGVCNLLYGYTEHPGLPVKADSRGWAYGNQYDVIDTWVKENEAVIGYR